jgi:hypothetical protein
MPIIFSIQSLKRLVVLSALTFCLLSLGSMAFAQSIHAHPGQWVDDLYLVDNFTQVFTSGTFERCFIDEYNKIHKKIPNITKAENFPVSPEFLQYAFSSLWHDDAFYAFVYGDREKNEDGSLFTRYILTNWKDGEWHFFGDYKLSAEKIGLLKCIPCDNGRFIVINSDMDLTDNKRPDGTPFHRMSIPEGKTELRIDAPIDHGQAILREHMHLSKCFGLAFGSKILKTDRHAVLVNTNTGIYWVFSLEKATLVKTGNIFSKMTVEMILNGGFPNPILCVNPEKDGTVLLSAQDEHYFVTETGDVFKEYDELAKNGFLNHEEAEKWFGLRLKELAERNPYIVWYRIYPETGKVEKLAYPPEGGTVHREGGKNDVWRPMPDGSVQMAWRESMIKEQSEDKKGDAAAENKEEKAQTSGAPAKIDGIPPQATADAKKTDAQPPQRLL